MTEENDKRLYAHFKDVIAGKYSTDNATSNALRISDAKKNMEELVKKRPLTIFEEVKPEVKSKGSK